MREEQTAKRDMSVPVGIVLLGIAGGVGTAFASSFKYGALVAAASVLTAVGVAAFRDPPASKGDSTKGASIDFGR